MEPDRSAIGHFPNDYSDCTLKKRWGEESSGGRNSKPSSGASRRGVAGVLASWLVTLPCAALLAATACLIFF